MVENGTPDDTATDDDDLGMAFHKFLRFSSVLPRRPRCIPSPMPLKSAGKIR
jgi:hypothetical protein